mgnify:FL=1
MRLFNKTIDLHFFTKYEYVYNYAKIRTGNETKPAWFKKLPTKAQREDDANIPDAVLKACPGIQDHHKNVIQMPLWSDLMLQIGPKGEDFYRWDFSDGVSEIREHPSKWINNYKKPNEFQHLMIRSPWLVKCNKDVNFLISQPNWHHFEFPTISVFKGVVSFYKQPFANTQLYVTRTSEYQKILLPHGTPLIDMTPLTDKKVKIHTHLIDSLKFETMNSDSPYCKFSGTHYYTRALLKKCPYN